MRVCIAASCQHYHASSIPSHVFLIIAQASIPSNSISFTTILMISLFSKSNPGFSTLSAMSLSMTPLRRETRTPILAHPRRRSHPSTTKPRPCVSSSIAPEKRRRVYALKALATLVSSSRSLSECRKLTCQIPHEYLACRHLGEVRYERRVAREALAVKHGAAGVDEYPSVLLREVTDGLGLGI